MRSMCVIYISENVIMKVIIMQNYYVLMEPSEVTWFFRTLEIFHLPHCIVSSSWFGAGKTWVTVCTLSAHCPCSYRSPHCQAILYCMEGGQGHLITCRSGKSPLLLFSHKINLGKVENAVKSKECVCKYVCMYIYVHTHIYAHTHIQP